MLGLIRLYKKSTLLRKILYIPKKIYDYWFFYLIEDKKNVEITFMRVYGYDLDLENPKTLNEKIQWLKIYDRTPLHTQCADKIAVREYVKEVIGEDFLIPLIFTTKNVEDICPENLPNYPFIIKTNHDSGTYFIVRNKAEIDWRSVRNVLKKALKRNYYIRSKEWQYKNISPEILVEKLLIDETGATPFDYKLHCFHGKTEAISVDMGRRAEKHYRNWYDREWKRLPFKWSSAKDGYFTDPSIKDVPEPLTLKKMITYSNMLSEKFKYVRVDWYDVDGKLYFGEITFHHDSGFRPIEPREWDYKMGDLLHLSE